MNRLKHEKTTLGERLISVFASLFFSVPTSVLLSFWLNQNMALLHVDFAIGGTGFIALVTLFSILAFVFPRIFPSILGWVWRLLIRAH